MPRNYQVQGPHRLDHELYMRMFWLMRDYKRLQARKTRILYGSPPPPDGMPKGSGTSNTTQHKAITLAAIDTDIRAIDEVIWDLKCKYAKTCTGEQFDPYGAYMDYGLFCYYRSRKLADRAPTRKTWQRYRNEFLYLLAKKLKLIL